MCKEDVDLSIRQAKPEDAESLLNIYSYYVSDTAVSFEYEVPTVSEFRGRIENTLLKYPYIVLEDGGEAVGYAYAGTFKNRAAYDKSCEISIYVSKTKKRRGYGKKLYLALEKELKMRGITNVYACIATPAAEDEYLTRDSELFHSRMGFVRVGEFHKCGYKFGRFYNMIWMEKIIGEHVIK